MVHHRLVTDFLLQCPAKVAIGEVVSVPWTPKAHLPRGQCIS